MTTRKDKSQAKPGTYEPEARYEVRFAKSVRSGAMVLRPGRRYEMTGAAAQAVADAIATAEKL